MSLPYLTTPEDTGIPNTPNDLCAELGRELVRLCLNNEQPKDMCHDCAFRLGSDPNRSYTAHDALASLINDVEFICHHGEDRPCAGFQRAHELKCLSISDRSNKGQASLTEMA
jgi:hypothetical protein